MTERPIIFDGESARAILAGHKTQTRRIIPLACDDAGVWADAMYPAGDGNPVFWWGVVTNQFTADLTRHTYATGMPCRYGAPGDRLWVREGLRLGSNGAWVYAADHASVLVAPEYSAASAAWAHHKAGDVCSPIHMPRWVARILLTVIDVRVERLQTIDEGDAQREGWDWTNIDVYQTYDPVTMTAARDWYARRWDAINGKRAPWASDPWVWVVDFEVCDVS